MLTKNQCPWDRFEKGTISFCEKPLCSWVVKPAETWSNIGYIIVGIYVLKLAVKENQTHLKKIGHTGITLGLFSGIFHATGTFFGEFLDVSSMFLFTCLGISYNAQRLFNLNQNKVKLIFYPSLLSSMALLLIYRPIGIPLFAIQFTTAIIFELILYLNGKKGKAPIANYYYFKLMAITFVISWIVWWLDLLKIVCDPTNHFFNGHAFWHLGTSLSFYFVYRFFTQFNKILKE